MYTSIAHFLENGIPNLVKLQESFFSNPTQIAELVEGFYQELLQLGEEMLSETLEQMDAMLCESGKRRQDWEVVHKVPKQLLTRMGLIRYERTCFHNKKTGKNRCLLDQLMGLEAHERMTEDVEAEILKQAVHVSYEKTGKQVVANEVVSKQTVKNKVDSVTIPTLPEKPEKKRNVDYLYVEADEAHIALQYKETRGDLKGKKNKGCYLAKLVYIHEGHRQRKGSKERAELVRPYYICGTYPGKEENEQLWKQVQEYIEENYERDRIKKIYFQSDGGSWMKKGMERLGSAFVLDEFHLEKYKKKALKGIKEEEKEEAENELIEAMKQSKKQAILKWKEKWTAGGEDKKVEEGIQYLYNHWEGAKRRFEKEEGVIGSSTEGHVSHVLAERMSSRPMGWSKKGTDQMAKLRAYAQNGGDMLKLVRESKRPKKVEVEEENEIISSCNILRMEKQQAKQNGKWIEALQAQLSPTMKMTIAMQEHIWGL